MKRFAMYSYFALSLTCALGTVFGQNRLDFRTLHERILIVVPLTGAGTYADPRRPLLVPGPKQTGTGILSYQWQPSDDGNYAIVELAASDRKALVAVLADNRIVKALEKGKHHKLDIEKELKKYKKDFTLGQEKKP